MIQLVHGDITTQVVDAIVNAANPELKGGGGVDGAIHRVGGPSILQACQAIVREKGLIETGQSVLTTAGVLPCRWVIHTVGPIYDPQEPVQMKTLLSASYLNCLRLANQRGIHTIAFPNISTGVYGYPKAEAADVAIKAVESFLQTDHELQKICYVCFDHENYEIYSDLLL